MNLGLMSLGFFVLWYIGLRHMSLVSFVNIPAHLEGQSIVYKQQSSNAMWSYWLKTKMNEDICCILKSVLYV